MSSSAAVGGEESGGGGEADSTGSSGLKKTRSSVGRRSGGKQVANNAGSQKPEEKKDTQGSEGQDIAMGLKADDGSSVATADKSEASKRDANEASGSKDVTSGAADTSTGADIGEPEDEDVAGGDDLDDLEDDGDEDEDDEDIDGSGNTAGTPSTSSPVKAESEDGLVTGSSDADPSTVGGSESGQGSGGTGGEPQTIQGFIFSAIGVMKNRKARPDTKRICNWIHRRYGHPVQAVSDELERLVEVGQLARVDYKGSASFRMVDPNGKVKRKRRSLKIVEGSKPPGVPNPILSGTAANSALLTTGISPPGTTMGPAPPLPQPPVGGIPPLPTTIGFVNGAGPMETPTLRTLVLDLLAESGVVIIEPTTTISSGDIRRAVQQTQRNIPKAGILDNLDKILAREIELGNFANVTEDTYRLPPDGMPYELPMPKVPRAPMAPPPVTGGPGPLPDVIGGQPMAGNPQPMIVPTTSLSSPSGAMGPMTPIGAQPAYQQQQFSFMPATPGSATRSSFEGLPTTPPPLTVQSPPADGTAHLIHQMGPPVSTHMPMRPPPPTSAGCLPPITSLTPPPTKACPMGIGGAMGMTTGGDPGATLTLIPPPQPHPVTTTTASLPAIGSKSDEERKNDLINKTLFKMSKSDKQDKTRNNASNTTSGGGALSPGKSTTPGSSGAAQSGTKSGNEFHLTLKENLKAGKASKKGGGALSRRNSTTSAGANSSTSGKGSSGANRRNSSGVTSKMLEPQVEIKSEPMDCLEPPRLRVNSLRIQAAAAAAAGTTSVSNNESSSNAAAPTPVNASTTPPPGKPGRKRKRTDTPEPTPTAPVPTATTGVPNPAAGARGGRKKFSKKIFDPADHDQPQRKVKRASGGSRDGGNAPAADTTVKAENTCMVCTLPIATSVSTGVGKMACPGSLSMGGPPLRCSNCGGTVHPACMEYTEELTKKIISMPWQCTSCKTCHMCSQANDDDCMLVCDSCDLGFHMACHKPPLSKPPSTDKWECFRCSPEPPASTPKNSRGGRNNSSSISEAQPLKVTIPQRSGTEAITNGFHSKSESQSHPTSSTTTRRRGGQGSKAEVEGDSSSATPGGGNSTSATTKRFLPLLPPHLHPHTGLLPDNWEDYEPDPTIPDVSAWNAKRIRDYFSSNGFSDEVCQTILDQEIDGGSLLLLHRQDVISGLGLKLGPALKVFKQVKKLQTRRHFPS